jgi:fatty acid kinase
VLEALDADAVRLWSRTAVALLDEHRAEIDALNVFPVPDSDTGSNTLTTLRAADSALAAAGALDAAAALSALAIGAAHGAQGNSGFIVSQVVRGLADAAVDAAARSQPCDGPVVAAGLDTGAELARAAVVTPVDGTILTVARAAADGAVGAGLADVVTAAARAADVALQHTPAQLAELAQAGVVDAGGRALLIVLAALARVVTGAPFEITPVRVPLSAEHPTADHATAEHPTADHPTADHPTSSGYGFEVQYQLDAPAAAVPALRAALSVVGDSVAVVATEAGSWNVHVHVDDVGAALNAGLDAGRPHDVSVVRFADAASEREPEPNGNGSAVLAVAPGAGLAHLFEREGVQVVDGGPDDRPDTAAVLAGIRACGSREVVVLPNATRLTGVAEAAAVQARAHGLRVAVVPTRSPVQALAAIAVHDPGRRFDDDVVAMAEAAAATRHAEITIARSEALTAVGICQPGDTLGLIDGEVVAIGRGLMSVLFGLVDRLLGVGAELITVLVGADAPPQAGDYLAAHVVGRSPLTDVTVYAAGQVDHPVIIGVE